MFVNTDYTSNQLCEFIKSRPLNEHYDILIDYTGYDVLGRLPRLKLPHKSVMLLEYLIKVFNTNKGQKRLLDFIKEDMQCTINIIPDSAQAAKQMIEERVDKIMPIIQDAFVLTRLDILYGTGLSAHQQRICFVPLLERGLINIDCISNMYKTIHPNVLFYKINFERIVEFLLEVYKEVQSDLIENKPYEVVMSNQKQPLPQSAAGNLSAVDYNIADPCIIQFRSLGATT